MEKKLSDINWDIDTRDTSNQITRSTHNVHQVKELLNSKGCGFCLAKFTQVTLHLGIGKVHSCHHPTAHTIPLDEIAKSPSALFNTQHLKRVRSEMLNGQRPPECGYCWRIEDNNELSDRFFKSLESWAIEKHDIIQSCDPNSDFFPSYLEVDFSNVCNFKCVYCGPEFSSKWVEEIKQNGPIKVLDETKYIQWVQGWQKNLDELSYKNNEFNPYVDAFWKWWPEAYKHLKVYRITGGEPLLSKETFRSMEYLINNPNPDLEFSINTNMGAPDKLWDKFVEQVEILANGEYVKNFTVFTSVDAWAERAEYLRPGLNFELFKKRYEQLLQIGTVRVTTMVTYNVLSISSIQDLFEWHLFLRKKYNPNPIIANLWEKDTGFNFGYPYSSYTDRKIKSKSFKLMQGIDIPYLRHPTFLDSQYATRSLIQEYLIPSMNFMSFNRNVTNIWNQYYGFEEFEIEKYKRVCLDILYSHKNEGNKDFAINRAKFYEFVNELDRRYKTNFLEVYPEYREFYELGKEMKERIIKGEYN